MTDRPPLPDWPAMMDPSLAAQYCGGLSDETFSALASRAGVRPVDLGFRRTLYRRRDLDGMIDRFPLRPAQSGDPEGRVAAPQATAGDIDDALARVERRLRRG